MIRLIRSSITKRVDGQRVRLAPLRRCKVNVTRKVAAVLKSRNKTDTITLWQHTPTPKKQKPLTCMLR